MDAAELAQHLRSLPARREARAQEQAAREQAERLKLTLDRAQARRGLWKMIAAMMVVGLVVASYLLWQSIQARRVAQAEASRANAVTSFLTDDLLSAANPIIAGRRDVSMREVLDHAQQQLDAKFKDQPHAHATLERVIGSAYAAMGESEPATRLLTAAEKELSAQQGETADETQAARTALRDMYLNQLDIPNMFRMSKRIADIEKAAGTPHPDIAADAAGLAAELQCGAQYLSVLVNRCDEVTGAAYRDALARFGPDNLATLRLLMYQGIMLGYTERYTDALPLLRTANDGLRRFYGNDSLWMNQSDGVLAISLIGAGLAQEALPQIEARFARNLQVYGPDHRQTLVDRRHHARANFAVGQIEAALAEQKDVQAIWLKKGAALRPQDDGPVAIDLAITLEQLNRAPEAQGVIRDALARIVPQQQPTGYETLRLREQLAHLSLLLRDDAGAERLLRQNLAEAKAAMTHGEWLLGWDQFLLGDFLRTPGHCSQLGMRRCSIRWVPTIRAPKRPKPHWLRSSRKPAIARLFDRRIGSQTLDLQEVGIV